MPVCSTRSRQAPHKGVALLVFGETLLEGREGFAGPVEVEQGAGELVEGLDEVLLPLVGRLLSVRGQNPDGLKHAPE